jgi:transposase InsO family protein
LADVAFPILGVDFLRAHKLLIDPEGHALLDSTGRRLTGQLLRSPPTAKVVVGFVQPNKPMVESSSSSAHTAGAASAGAANAGAASAGAANAGAASAGAANAGAASAWAASAEAASAGPVSAAGEQAGQVLQALQDNGLVIHAEKCVWGVQELEYLGHKISAAGVLPLPSHVAAIQDFPRPTIIKELQAFLGMGNFYRRFLPSIARMLQPLSDALRGGRKGADKLEWSAAMDAAFAGAKQSLLTATHLAHRTVGAELSVVVDASATHIGACLQQRLPGRKVWQPLGFFSKKLEAAQQKYSAFDRELFACYAGIHHFRYMLDGRRFAIFTDHKPLTYALARVSEPWTARQSRQLFYVAEFTSDIRHIAGAANVVADTLSRPPGHAAAERPPSAATCVKAPSGSQVVALQGGKLNSSPPSLPGVAASVADVQPATGVSFHRMAANQVSCPSTLQATKSSSLAVRTVQAEGASLLCDVARGITRPLVPVEDRPAVFHAIHNVAHPGIRATKRMLTARFVWKGVGKDVAAMYRACQQCQRGKVHKQPAAPVQAIPVPARKFSHMHVDLVGPLPASSEGHVYLLTIIDRSTRWFEAVPLRNMEASMCVDAFISSWVARFGVPETVTTDRGTQFTSALWSSTCTSLGIKHVLTTAYHPQSNGMVECEHRQHKDALRARGAGPAWHSHLPWVLLGLCAAPKKDSAVSSAELVTGTPLVLHGQLLHVPDPPREDVPPPPTRPLSYAAAANTPPAHLARAEHVYVRVGGSLHLHEAADWGGPCVKIFIRSMCLPNCGASEAVYPCNVVEKIHEYFRSKMCQYL